MSLMYPKPIRHESPLYLAFIRGHMCLVPKCFKAPQAHHIVMDGQGRIGSKVSDYQAVPLCEKHHRQYHDCGRERFAEWHGLNLYQIVIDLLTEYVVQREEVET